MLLNLDLFKPAPQGSPGDGDSGGESLFDQIRTYNSLGMLGGENRNAPANYPVAPNDEGAPAAPPPPAPYNAPQSDFRGQPE
jgi:hypothetical protein